MASTKRTWLWVIFGVAISLALCVIVLLAVGAYTFSRQVRSELVSRVSAQDEFTRQRDRFAGQQPLVEMKGDFNDRQVTVHRSADGPRKDLARMRVLVYDEDQGRLVHVDLPFWLLKLMPLGRIRSVGGANAGFSLESSRITVEDLERHGPGLILDLHDGSGAQVLIWTE